MLNRSSSTLRSSGPTGPLAAFLCAFRGLILGGAAAGADAAAAAGDVQVKDAWIRWLPAGAPAAGYLTLTNTGSTELVLIGASSADFGEVSLHFTHNHEGMSMMEPMESLVLKPHATVRFAEGGYHIMFKGPKRALHPGDKVNVALRLRGGAAVDVGFDVRAGNSGAP